MYLTSEDIKDLENSISNRESAKCIKHIILSSLIGYLTLNYNYN